MSTEPTSRAVLAHWPTPIERAPRLAVALGLSPDDLWIKRDDLSGLAGGGNKTRKLEWTVAAATDSGADTLITTGAAQSNHARLTAAAGARLGLRVVLVLAADGKEQATGNLALEGLLGADIVWAGTSDAPKDGLSLEQRALAVAEQLTAEGRHPSIIPFGGSNATGAHGYRLAAAELLEQLPSVDHVVVAVGSGGTMAGLVAGLGVDRVLGVHTGAVSEPREVVSGILDQMPSVDVGPASLRLRLDQVGAGYETFTSQAADALQLAARTEGVILDPVYTARALAGLRAEVADGGIRPGQQVVFMHTGGLPGLFGHPHAMALADALTRPTD